MTHNFKRDRMGNILITRVADGADCYLQGDDATELGEQIGSLGELQHPVGPFATYESHLDYILSQYDTVMG